MKAIRLAALFFLAGVVPGALQGCVYLTAPLATAAFGGAGLAIKGAELRNQIKRADSHDAIDTPFEKTWDVCLTVLSSLDIDVVRAERTPAQDGGVIEGKVKKTNIRVVVAEFNDKITEVGIWANHDKALAGLIAQKIKDLCAPLGPLPTDSQNSCLYGLEFPLLVK